MAKTTSLGANLGISEGRVNPPLSLAASPLGPNTQVQRSTQTRFLLLSDQKSPQLSMQIKLLICTFPSVIISQYNPKMTGHGDEEPCKTTPTFFLPSSLITRLLSRISAKTKFHFCSPETRRLKVLRCRCEKGKEHLGVYSAKLEHKDQEMVFGLPGGEGCDSSSCCGYRHRNPPELGAGKADSKASTHCATWGSACRCTRTCSASCRSQR